MYFSNFFLQVLTLTDRTQLHHNLFLTKDEHKVKRYHKEHKERYVHALTNAATTESIEL